MESEYPARWLSYIIMLGFFFSILFIVDLFGVKYGHPTHHLSVDEEKKETKNIKPHAINPDLITEKKPTTEKKPVEVDSTELPPENKPEKEPDLTYFDNLKENYQERVLNELQGNKVRSDVVIRYYEHQPDGNSAYALKKLKFYIHERPVDPAFEKFKSNAIFYGDNVPDEDIQLVAYTLISEGLPVKVIKPSQFHDDWKANAIEIGTDTTLVDQPTLTMEEIKDFSKF